MSAGVRSCAVRDDCSPSGPTRRCRRRRFAEAACVTWGLVAHYFGGKRGLHLEVVRSLVDVPSDALEMGGRSLEERIDLVMDFRSA